MFDLKQAVLTLLFFSGMLHITESEKKLKRAKSRYYPPPKYFNYQSERLPNDLQVSVFLYKEESKQFYYFSSMSNTSFSITVTSCLSPIHWTVTFRQNTSDTLLKDLVTKDNMQTVHLKALQGLYMLNLESTERDSFGHIYVSTEPEGPQALLNSNRHKLKLLKKQRSKRLSVRWDPSLVDPQGTDYCLVMNTRRHYASLCSAQEQNHDEFVTRSKMKPKAASQTVITTNDDHLGKYGLQHLDPVIVCVGQQTHYTVSDLHQGQGYYLDLFAINRQSNLTYPHGSAHITFDNRIKPLSLKDGRSSFVNLKKHDGRVVFRYKVGRRSGNVLELYFMPCGGSIDVVITLKGETVVTKTRIEGFGRIFISKLVKGQRYYIKVFSTNMEELRKTSGIEIFATTKPSSRTPLPNIPKEPMVQEYVSLRQCNSVTVGWLPSPGQKSAHYCLVVREGKIGDAEGFRLPNQCGLENRLKKSADFAFKYCRDRYNKEKVLMQRINQLRPGRHYVIQVTVKKPKGKTLSYDLLQVQTKPSCELLS